MTGSVPRRFGDQRCNEVMSVLAPFPSSITASQRRGVTANSRIKRELPSVEARIRMSGKSNLRLRHGGIKGLAVMSLLASGSRLS